VINDSYDKFCRILNYTVKFVIALIINTTKTSAQTTKHSCCNITINIYLLSPLSMKLNPLCKAQWVCLLQLIKQNQSWINY